MNNNEISNDKLDIIEPLDLSVDEGINYDDIYESLTLSLNSFRERAFRSVLGRTERNIVLKHDGRAYHFESTSLNGCNPRCHLESVMEYRFVECQETRLFIEPSTTDGSFHEFIIELVPNQGHWDSNEDWEPDSWMGNTSRSKRGVKFRRHHSWFSPIECQALQALISTLGLNVDLSQFNLAFSRHNTDWEIRKGYPFQGQLVWERKVK